MLSSRYRTRNACASTMVHLRQNHWCWCRHRLINWVYQIWSLH
jgi:hypothetical protein